MFQTFVATLNWPQRFVRKNLNSALKEIGVPVMSSRLARKHKRRAFREGCPDILGRVLNRVVRPFWRSTLFLLRRYGENTAFGLQLLTAVLSWVFIVVATSTLPLAADIVACLLTPFAVTYGVFVCLAVGGATSSEIPKALMTMDTMWVRLPLAEFCGISSMPPHLHKRAELATTLPEVRAEVELLDDDPLLRVSRGWGPFKRIAYIGAWDTGDPELDEF